MDIVIAISHTFKSNNKDMIDAGCGQKNSDFKNERIFIE